MAYFAGFERIRPPPPPNLKLQGRQLIDVSLWTHVTVITSGDRGGDYCVHNMYIDVNSLGWAEFFC